MFPPIIKYAGIGSLLNQISLEIEKSPHPAKYIPYNIKAINPTKKTRKAPPFI